MKKNSTNPTIKMLGLTVMALMAMLTPAFCQDATIDANVVTYTMGASSNQQVKFRVPLDIRSGDIITGTVMEEKKNNAVEVNRSSSTLEGMVIEIDGKQTKLSSRLISFIVPAGLASLPFLLKNSAGKVIEQGQIPIGVSSYFNTPAQESFTGLGNKFTPDAVSQPGQTLKVTGAFDGNAANTNISLNGQPCQTIAESPRASFVQVPQNAATGVSNISINENNVKEEHKMNIAVLNLTANKTSLVKGEKATINVSVSGLEGLDKGTDCKLAITNLSPSVVRINNTDGNTITKTIPQGLTADYNFSFNIMGVARGNYSLEGSLLSDSKLANNAKTVSYGPQYTAWQQRYKRALRKRLIEEGFTGDEISGIVVDSFDGIKGIIKNLWRLYKAMRAMKKAREDAGTKPDEDK